MSATDGWKCPGCGRCYAPAVGSCSACDPMSNQTYAGDFHGMPFFVEKRLSCCLCAKSVAVTIDGICLACLGCPSHLQAVIEAKAEADHD